MLYLIWYDDNSKTPVVDKIQAAMVAYVARFKMHPNLVLVNTVDRTEMADMLVRCERTVPPNTFWIGREEAINTPGVL